MRRHPVTGVNKLHTGQDFAAPAGTPVRAIGGGKVILNQWNKAYGNFFAIRHPDGTVSRYAHMKSRSPFKVGSMIKPGQVIGGVGSTGYSTGNHLHLEILRGGKFVDPLKFLSSMKGGGNRRDHNVPQGSTHAYGPSKGGGGGSRMSSFYKAPRSIQSYITSSAKKYNVHPGLIGAIIRAESGYRQNIGSGAGAWGLMQLMPWAGSARKNAASNVAIGTRYIREQLNKFGDVRLALAAYNWGPGSMRNAIRKYGNNWSKIRAHLPRETRTYVDRVLGWV